MEEDETIYSLTMIIPFGFIVQISNEDLKVFSGKKKEESLFHKKKRKKERNPWISQGIHKHMWHGHFKQNSARARAQVSQFPLI